MNREEMFEKEDFENFDYNNEYGAFNKEGNEYWIKQLKGKRIPVAWSNIITNDTFGSVITDGMGGFTWYINSQTNRLTTFSNDALCDCSSENFILEIEDKRWSLDINNLPDENQYYTRFGFGYASFMHESNDIKQQLDIYIPQENNVKINILKLKNTGDNEINLNINYVVEWQMGQNAKNSIITKTHKEELNLIYINNLMNTKYDCYITSNEKIDKNGIVNIKLKSGEYKEIVYILGVSESETEAIDIGTKYLKNYNEIFEKTKKWWKDKVTRITSKTPFESFDIMQNGWLVYQTLVSRMISKTGFYQSGGGFGFRDQLQDSLGMKWVDTEILKNQILLNAAHQFFEGDVEHWWHENSKLGIRTRYSDDMLWLVYAVEEYIEFTGDYTILEIEIPYLAAEKLKENEKERVEYYMPSDKKGTLFEHCMQSLKCASKLGEHNLPLMKSGDWNDGMNKIGTNNKGESVWLGFFLYMIIERFKNLIEYKKSTLIISKEQSLELGIEPTNIEYINKEILEEFEKNINEQANKIKKALNTTAWDGRWFRRAFDDEGNVIGSNSNKECKIDSICQSFAVISNAADNDKKYIAMNSLENYLVDNENSLIKLLTPALYEQNLGYITAYQKGMRENGGQYTHAAIWAMIAETMLNRNDEAIDFYKKINPIEHTNNYEKLLKYKVEPYVVAADIYSENDLAGRGGWTWYTGSSAWLYEAQIKYILGLKINKGFLEIKPCVPEEWKDFKVIFKWKDAKYTINYKQTGKYYIRLYEENNLNYINKENIIKLKDKGNWIIDIFF